MLSKIIAIQDQSTKDLISLQIVHEVSAILTTVQSERAIVLQHQLSHDGARQPQQFAKSPTFPGSLIEFTFTVRQFLDLSHERCL